MSLKVANYDEKNKKLISSLIVIAAFICLFIIYSGISYYYNYSEKIKVDTKYKLYNSINLGTKEFELFKQEGFNIVKRFSESEKFYTNLCAYLNNRNKTSELIIDRFFENNLIGDKIHRFLVFDSNFKLLTSTPKSFEANPDFVEIE